jgi:hypothetical protein
MKLLKNVLIKAYLKKGRPLPYCVRSQYILKIYFDAIAKYNPEPYTGSAIYIRSEERSRHHVLQWSGLIQGGLEILEVPATDHSDIIQDRNVRIWVERLKRALLESASKQAAAVYELAFSTESVSA